MLQEDLRKPSHQSLKRQSSVEAVFAETSTIQDRETEKQKELQVKRKSLRCPNWSRKCRRDIEWKEPTEKLLLCRLQTKVGEAKMVISIYSRLFGYHL